MPLVIVTALAGVFAIVAPEAPADTTFDVDDALWGLVPTTSNSSSLLPPSLGEYIYVSAEWRVESDGWRAEN